MKDILKNALKKANADYAEIRFETEDSTSLAYRGKEVERVSSGKYSGGIVRACKNGGWATAVFDSADDIAHNVREACRSAALVGREKTELAETDPIPDREIRAQMKNDPRGVGLDDKLKVIREYNEIILSSAPKIESSMLHYSDKFRTVHFASTRGSYFMEERPRIVLHFSATARDGSLVQQSADGISSTDDYNAVLNKEKEVETVSRRAAALLTAPACKGGKHTVILDPELAGVFVHEAFGHLSEADFLYENAQMKELMHLGRDMGVKELNIYDDGSMERLAGTQTYDDEGTPAGRTYLIREGVLAGHLHSLETAAKMGEKPTGNARAIGRTSSPIVRMTNTVIEPGDKSFDELISGIDNGIYACSMIGGQTMMEMFTFSAGYGYRIENGQVGELVRDIVLTGNVFETLGSIDGFGNDLEISQKGGGCGKGGQAPLPVTFGSPHIRIRDLVVGGTQ